MSSRRKTFSCLFVIACLGLLATAASGLAAAPGWQPVGITGPTVIPPMQNEQQKLFVDATAGTFTLSARTRVATGIGDYDLSEPLVNVATKSGAFAAGQVVEGFGIRPGTTITSVLGKTLSLSQGTERGELGVQTPIAAFGAASSTAPLSFDASAAEVQAALEALAPIGAGNVEVSGGPGGPNAAEPYVVEFVGSLAEKDVGQVAADSSSLTGNATTLTTVFGGPGVSTLSLMVQNVGDAPSSGQIAFKATLPEGVAVLGSPTSGKDGYSTEQWACGASTASKISCTWQGAVRPSLLPRPINATLVTAPGAENGEVQMEVSGGGAASAVNEVLPLKVSSTPAEPGFQAFVARAYDEEGAVDSRAGGHPASAGTAVFFNTKRTLKGHVAPIGEIKDLIVKLPPGFLGNPTAVPACPESTPTQDCPLESMVAVITPATRVFGTTGLPAQVYNAEAPFGYPAKFRFRISESADLSVSASLRSDGDYGVDAGSLRTPEFETFYGAFFTFWGEPASPSHDSVRCSQPPNRANSIPREEGCRPSTAPNNALLTNPTNCAEQAAVPPSVGLDGTLWMAPDDVFTTSFGILPVTGCADLEPEAGFGFGPDSSEGERPASFTTTVTVPTEGLTDPEKLITPTLKDTVVNLPEGVILNAAAADGLEACSLQQIGYLGGGFPMPNPLRFDKSPNTCPDASKIGTAELDTPLLAEPLSGEVYLAAQGDGNPFGSLFAIYLAIEDPDRGIVVKLPGKVETDAATGQVKATFANLPQLPFSRLDLKLKGGPRSPLATPSTCGSFSSAATFTPWSAPESGPPLQRTGSFAIDGNCAPSKAQRPFDLGFAAGTTAPLAGMHAPFTMRITRPDGNQELDTISATMPPGLLARLQGVAICSDAALSKATSRNQPGDGSKELQDPSCPPGSQVGTTTIGAGVGPQPFYVKGGKAYLTGPYKGAPASITFVVPALAGPFDLGVQVVRTALQVNPKTAQVTAVSDSIPRMLAGVPVQIRDVRIDVDRPGFILNPTNCEAMSVSAQVTGASGASATLSNRFQVDGCKDLPFKPKLSLQLQGKPKRAAYQRLTATLTTNPGEANISRAAVTFPHSIFLAQEHIGTVCTRVQFAADACPAASVYGYAEAVTPLLDGTIQGPVYLRSSDNPLPDLVAALRGPDTQPIEVELSGRTDSKNQGIRNTFDIVPDAPVSKFVLRMAGGKKSLLVASQGLCTKKPQRAIVRLAAQNGKRHDFRPALKVKCAKKKAKGAKKRRG